MKYLFWVLGALMIFACPLSFANESKTWQRIYQAEWYPSEPQIKQETQAHLKRMFPEEDYRALHHLSEPAQQKLLHAAAIYLRLWDLGERTENISVYAQLITELSKPLNAPLATAEGHYFWAAWLIEDRKPLEAIQRHITAAEQLIRLESLRQSHPLAIEALEIRMLILKARLYIMQGNFAKITSSMERSQIKATQLNDPSLTLLTHYYKGVSHYLQMQPELALEALYEALRQDRQLPHHPMKPKIQRILGLTYLRLGKMEAALDHLQKATNAFLERKMLSSYALSLRNLGNIYLSIGKFNEAIAIFENSLAIERQHGPPKPIGRAYLMTAQAYLEAGEHKTAQSYLAQAQKQFQIAQRPIIPMDLLRVQLIQARLLAASGDKDNLAAAVKLAEQIHLQVEKENHAQLLSPSTQTLSQLYQLNGQYQESSKFLSRELDKLRAQLKTTQNRRMQEVEEKYQHEQTKQQLSELQLTLQLSQKSNERYQNYAVALLLLTTFTLTLTLGLKYKLTQNNRDLTKLRLQNKRNPSTGLANEREMYHQLHEEIKRLQGEQEHWYASSTGVAAPAGTLFILLKIPALAQISEQLGLESGRKFERKLGHYLRNQFEGASIFQPRDNLFGLILPTNQPQIIATKIFSTIEGFMTSQRTELTELSMGMIHYPFIGKACKSTGINVVGELLLLALSGASQLSRKHHQHAWVALEAIDGIPLSLFSSQIRDNLLLAIDKGFIKVLTEFDKMGINWPKQASGTSLRPQISVNTVE